MRKRSAAIAFSLFLTAGTAIAADHGDAPGVRFDARSDINDVYLFKSPTQPNQSVLIMTVSPLAGITGPTTFNPSTFYDFFVDDDGDAVQDQRLRVTFSAPNAAGVQQVTLARRVGDTATKLGEGATGQQIPLTGGGKMQAGIFDDPFFFDLIAFKNAFNFNDPGDNFFRGLNTLAIVVQLPTNSLIGNVDDTTFGIWARTFRDGAQVDRMGRPAINTALIPGARKDEFNQSNPDGDRAAFKAAVKKILRETFGRSNPQAEGIATALLPDILTYDASNGEGFLNGRKLTDDVIDAELGILTGGGITTDNVDSDNEFQETFPYLGAKNP
jgi:hypothetical protein